MTKIGVVTLLRFRALYNYSNQNSMELAWILIDFNFNLAFSLESRTKALNVWLIDLQQGCLDNSAGRGFVRVGACLWPSTSCEGLPLGCVQLWLIHLVATQHTCCLLCCWRCWGRPNSCPLGGILLCGAWPCLPAHAGTRCCCIYMLSRGRVGFGGVCVLLCTYCQ